MSRKNLLIITVILIAIILAWSPWLTKEYSFNRVIKHLGGPEVKFNWTGIEMPVKDVPKDYEWLPFIRIVTFPGESMYIITLWGLVIG